jgi:phosphoglycerate kinase
MITSHLERSTEGEFQPEDSLAPVAKRLADYSAATCRWWRTESKKNGGSVASGQVVPFLTDVVTAKELSPTAKVK